MTQKLSIVTATPEVILTKKRRGMVEPYIEVRAGSLSPNRLNDVLSVFYDAESWKVPTVRERLLVAVLSGVQPQWLTDQPGSAKEDITFHAASSLPRVLSSSSGHDTVHMGTVEIDTGLNRLRIWLRDEDDELLGNVVLSKGQVEGMIAALLAIYPRLEEN